MTTIQDAVKAVKTLLDWCAEHEDYSEFEDDLYSLLDSLNEDQRKQSK